MKHSTAWPRSAARCFALGRARSLRLPVGGSPIETSSERSIGPPAPGGIRGLPRRPHGLDLPLRSLSERRSV